MLYIISECQLFYGGCSVEQRRFETSVHESRTDWERIELCCHMDSHQSPGLDKLSHMFTVLSVSKWPVCQALLRLREQGYINSALTRWLIPAQSEFHWNRMERTKDIWFQKRSVIIQAIVFNFVWTPFVLYVLEPITVVNRWHWLPVNSHAKVWLKWICHYL